MGGSTSKIYIEYNGLYFNIIFGKNQLYTLPKACSLKCEVL